MARLTAHKKKDNDIEVTLKVSQAQYKLLKEAEEDLLVLPTDTDCMAFELTTGKIGNGNRVMLPNKILARNEVKVLHKKLPSRIVEIDGRKLLVCVLEDERPGMPKFED